MKAITFLSTIILLGIFNILYSQNQSTSPPIHYLDPYNPEYVEGEILVKFRYEVKVDIQQRDNQISTGLISIDDFLVKYEATALTKVFRSKEKKETRYINTHKGERIEVPQLFNIYMLKFNSTQDAKELAELLSEDPMVEFAEPNYLVYTTETYPDDPLYQDDSQWYIDAVDAPLAWDLTTGDTNQIIGILDTGIDFDHPDLDDNIWTNWDEIPNNSIDDDGNGYVDDRHGWDFVNNDNDPNDNNSHGTHISGIAAGEGNNSTGITGMVWTARIMPVKILNSTGYGSSSNFAQAIEYASDNGAVIINMSLGSYAESSIVETALLNAYSEAILVAAAGNDAKKLVQEGVPSGNFFPACYDFVLGVMAAENDNCDLAAFTNIDPSGPIEFWNNWGYNYELTAPGVNIMSTIPGGSYNSLNGTSMASAIVSGICALYKSHNDTASNEVLWANLIQGSQNGCVNAYNTLTFDLISYGADLRYIDFTLIDTLPGCDGDGRADAGETVEIYLTVKNVGDWADSVWSKLIFNDLDDTTLAQIIDSTSYIGDISTWYTLDGALDPFILQLESNIPNNYTMNLGFEIGSLNGNDTLTDIISISIVNGIEIGGLLTGNITWDAGHQYLIIDNARLDENASLTVLPGTEIYYYPYKDLEIRGNLTMIGTPDSLITHNRVDDIYYGGGIVIKSLKIDTCIIAYNKFSGLMKPINLKPPYSTPTKIYNCIFEKNYSHTYLYTPGSAFIDFSFNNIINNQKTACINLGELVTYQINRIFKYNLLANNHLGSNRVFDVILVSNTSYGPDWAFGNSIFGNSNTSIHQDISVRIQGAVSSLPLENWYWGITDSLVIKETAWDFYDESYRPILDFSPYLDTPSAEVHGHVWKININDICVNKVDNPYNSPSGLGVVGIETLKFDVYFNRPMDTSYNPIISFGILDPYLQNIVNDSASWSNDSLIFTAYRTINQSTGDGINRVVVSGAKDTDHFEIPPENYRFEFVIQAASAASINFIATTGIGKVDLEWPPANTPDVLGYNLYRYFNLTDSTYSSTIKINDELIIDTTYTDFTVIPDTTYHYMYTILGTDMQESDFSKVVHATPFSAANGDANGDLSVNVLDITSVVAYMLNQNPMPFLFDAADVNSDDEINVLDIIGIIQLISAEKSVPLSNLIYTASEPAYISIEKDGIYLESEGNVAALQFKVQSSKLSEVKSASGGFKISTHTLQLGTRNPQQLDKLKIFSLQKGFEFAYGIVDEHIIGLLFSLTGKEIPAGDQKLFRFEGVDVSEIEITEIFGGDLNGDYVPVLKKGEQSSISLPEGYELTVQPNPFTSSTLISWQLAEEAMVDISICNLKGEKIKQIEQGYQSTGHFNKTWDGRDESQKQIATGIYICHMVVKTKDKKITKDVKIILMK